MVPYRVVVLYYEKLIRKTLDFCKIEVVYKNEN